MTPENELPTNENSTNNSPNNTPPAEQKESAMSILEKRLAEIEARRNTGNVNAQTAPAPAPTQATAPVEAPEKPATPEHAPQPEKTPVSEPVSEVKPSEMPVEEAGAPITEPMSVEQFKEEVLHENVVAEETSRLNQEIEPAVSGTELFNETIAAHEAMPPADQGPTALDTVEPQVSGVQAEETVVESVTSPEVETTETGNKGAIGTFSARDNSVSETTTEAERDAALGDPNSVGNVISGAIAAHEIIPEIMPGQRKEEEISSPAAGTSENIAPTSPSEAAPVFEVETEEFIETDYSTLPASELEKQINTLLKTDNRKNYRQVMAMYREYEVKVATEKNDALNKFVAEGGTSDDFEYRITPERQAIEKGMQQLRESRVRDQRSEEEQKQKNLQRKQELIAQLRELVESAETKSSGEKLKAIQEEWKATGPVPQAEAKELWNSYHALLDIFYNNRSIYFELKELDRKRNLNAKTQLIDRAEALANNPSINASLQELRNLHEEWKNLGPVPNDQRDSIWERFIQASEKVHDRKKEFLAGRREEETQNLTRKTEVLGRLEQFQNFNTDRINDWRDKTDEIQKIKEEWDAVGLVPKENADSINKQFWGIYKAFFHHKNQFFKALDEQKMQNLKLKTELCEQAEAVKDSTDWDATKEQLIQLQKKWKTIGRVPDKYSDKIWERFRAACNEFFDRRQAEAQNKEAEIDKLSSEKTTYLDELSDHLERHGHPKSGTLDELYQMVDKWKAFDSGNQRLNPRAEEKFYALMEKYLDTVPELHYDQKNDILFKLQMNKLKGGPDATSKLHQKEQSIRKEIQQLENDIRTLKTNIEFFAKSKNAEKLREEYQVRTDEANQRIAMLQKQLKEIRA
jgi:hypothetical protein